MLHVAFKIVCFHHLGFHWHALGVAAAIFKQLGNKTNVNCSYLKEVGYHVVSSVSLVVQILFVSVFFEPVKFVFFSATKFKSQM